MSNIEKYSDDSVQIRDEEALAQHQDIITEILGAHNHQIEIGWYIHGLQSSWRMGKKEVVTGFEISENPTYGDGNRKQDDAKAYRMIKRSLLKEDES